MSYPHPTEQALKRPRRSGAVAACGATMVAVVTSLGGCAGWFDWLPRSPTDGRTSSAHDPAFLDPSNAAFHGKVVKDAGYDIGKATWKGMACKACHAASDAEKADSAKGPPSCTACHSGGTDGSWHPPAWSNVGSAEFHGSVVKIAGMDYTKAKAGNATCNSCHAGESPSQASPMARAPGCFACHNGGPDGSADHPPGYIDARSPFFHGIAVVAAGYDYRKAMVGGLACSACHAGESPSQPNPNSRAPSCFPCHIGGPDGGADHPAGWGFLTGSNVGTAVWTCGSCHPAGPPRDSGELVVEVAIREATSSLTPTATP